MVRPTASIFLSAAAALALVVAGCVPVGVPSAGTQLTGAIKLVSSMPRTGAAKPHTDSVANAIRMALEDVHGRVASATLSYVDLDDASVVKGNWDAAAEAANANTALNDPDVMVYMGPFNSGAAAISIPILCTANLAMISPSVTYPGLTKRLQAGTKSNEPDIYYPGCRRNFTRVVPSDEIQGGVAARWSKDLGSRNVYVLHDSELYGQGIASFYARGAQMLGLTVVGGREGLDPKATDYRALAQKIRASGADLVFWGGACENNGSKLWQDLRGTLDPSVKLMGPDGIYGPCFLGTGPAAEGTFVTFGGIPAPSLTGAGATWYATYKQRWGEEPWSYTAYGYEAARVAIQAIERAGRKDRAAIRDALLATREYAGVLGRWSFTETGDTTLTTMSGRQVTGGTFDDAHAVMLEAPE